MRPSKADIQNAYGKTIPDIIAPDLRVLFCGINPSLYSAAAGHHFARPGNRFWPALNESGFTDRQISPFDDRDLLNKGIGITNLVARATATAAELSIEELAEGAKLLQRKAKKLRPLMVAFLGIGAFRQAFGLKECKIGLQELVLPPARVWVIPNPSGLNANYQLKDLISLFAALKKAAAT